MIASVKMLRALLVPTKTVTPLVGKEQPEAPAKLYVWSEGGWKPWPNYQERGLDSVILPDGDVESLVEDLRWFIQAEQMYVQQGVPYHRGYLFYGKPGTGKSSLIAGLANYFHLSMFLVSLNEVNDTELCTAIMKVRKGSIIVMEDMDKRDDIAGLLNVLDGFKAPSGVVFMMTTNHVDKLDSALTRPGRVDYQLEFTVAKLAQKMQMYRRFYPDRNEQQAVDFIMQHRDAMTMADFQMALLKDDGKASTIPQGRLVPAYPMTNIRGMMN